MDSIQHEDIQGIIIRGYKELSFARFVLVGFENVAKARAWAAHVPVTPASDRKPAGAIHLAFTMRGLKQFDFSEDQFVPEFAQGMSEPEHRRRLLGDEDAKWDWGTKDTPVDAVLLFYASDEAALAALEAKTYSLAASEQENGIRVIKRLETHTLRDGTQDWFREHFGFRDGVAQPSLAIANARKRDEDASGISATTDEANSVAAGEFLFGQDTEYGKPAEGGGPEDFARNGSFLVFRQLEQDVLGFWKDIRHKAREARIDPILLATKMVGRWPNGAPLVLAPEESTAGLETFDAFGYAATDPQGRVCPFSSHVRRSNPRDTLVNGDLKESIKLSKTHRLVRRGRPYGDPISITRSIRRVFLPRLDAMIANPPPGARGLHFLCFNTSIRRQFEFVQQTWLNNPKFAGQYASPDPIAGHFKPEDKAEFILPGRPASTRITDVKSFVQSKGGAYFFMPGIKSLRALARNGT